ncbi:integumentary mucin C.1-like [Haliotis rufescens]|uniref:integumentary mucin C.1-like n=1 Tax=Haliotis rufescens TaxID=6454 RepID=UPI001EAF96D4|nr:integumentary mucin C.1-like [Haliotis rufescens]
MYMFVFEVVTVYIICSHATCKGEEVFLTRVVPSSLVCDSLCAYTTRCGSYTWDAVTRSCHLHTQGDTGTETMPLAKYWKESQGMVCRGRPCKENEVCVPVEAGTNYVCVASTAATTTTTTTTPSTTPSATTTTNTTPQQTTTTRTPPPTTTTTTPSPPTTTTTPPPHSTTTTQSPTTTTTIPPPPTTTTTPSPTTTTTAPSPSITTTIPSPATTTTTPTSPVTTTTPPPTTTTTTQPPLVTTTTPSPATTTTTPSPTTTTPTTLPTTTTTTTCPATVNQANVPYTYVGCYADDWRRVLPYGKIGDRRCLTTETCKLHCHGMNYIYFGTEAGFECFCGDVIKGGYMKKPDSECNAPCTGDRSTMCGWHWRISIYKIV